MKESLLRKIEEKQVNIAIVGLGYVGLPLAMAFSQAEISVTGFDIDNEKIEMLNKGKSYIKHLNSEVINKAIENQIFKATSNFSEINKMDAIILCLPTPLNKYREPNLTFITDTMDKLKPVLKPGQILSLESTTYPGTTDEVIKPRIEDCGFTIGEDYFLAYSPEREDPGNPNYNTQTIPKVIGGITDHCLEIGSILYETIIKKVVKVSSTRAAELTKLLENIYRAVNIGLVNEMKIVADKMGIDIWEVVEAAATKPFGFTPFYPGPGWGGHCIPIDPFYLTWKAKEYGLNTRFIELSGEVNTMMPDWVVNKVIEGLNERGKPLKNSNVLILGLSYKKNIADVRESPSVKLMELLRGKGANVFYSDPHVPKFPKMREHRFELESLEITESTLHMMDCVLLATDHEAFNYDFILNNSDLIVDTRGIYRSGVYKNVMKA